MSEARIIENEQNTTNIPAENDNILEFENVESADNILFEMTNIIEQKGLQGKSIKINFGDIDVSAEIMANIQALAKGFYAEIALVYANSMQTKLSALEAGISVAGKKGDINPPNTANAEAGYCENNIVDAMNKVLAGSSETVKGTSADIIKEETAYFKQTLRSGQRIEHDGNVVIIGDCKAGSEIIATGDITIWGILSGVAHAGSKGDYNASIRAFRINAIQLRIADLLARKPDSAELEKIDKASGITPEEAKITGGEIVIYSLN